VVSAFPPPPPYTGGMSASGSRAPTAATATAAAESGLAQQRFSSAKAISSKDFEHVSAFITWRMHCMDCHVKVLLRALKGRGMAAGFKGGGLVPVRCCQPFCRLACCLFYCRLRAMSVSVRWFSVMHRFTRLHPFPPSLNRYSVVLRKRCNTRCRPATAMRSWSARTG
jgi:hypothetical protein